jgi:hypothetical protein
MEIPQTKYQSPLYVSVNKPSLVIYRSLKTMLECGRVYKSECGKWFLSSEYLNDWEPVEVFHKYSGFITLNTLHKLHNNK